MEAFVASIKTLPGYEMLIAILMKRADFGENLNVKFQIDRQMGVCSLPMIQHCQVQLSNFLTHHAYSVENLEHFFNVKVCRIRIRGKKWSFIDEPTFSQNIVFVNEKR